MSNKKAISPIEPYKKLIQDANIFKDSNPKIYYAARKYAVEKISVEMKQNPNALTSQDKTEFESIIKDMISQKTQNGSNFFANQEEYTEFITNLFANVDDEERDESIEVSQRTASKFRLCSELIDVLELYAPLSDTWKKNRKNICLSLDSKVQQV